MQETMQQEDAALEFKRFILEKSDDFSHEPMADLYRVNLLSMMLNRYEELLDQGVSPDQAIRETRRAFDDIAQRMRHEGFGAAGEKSLSENEAERYIRESNANLHRRALGIGLLSACVMPLMIAVGISEVFWMMEEVLVMTGMMGMFGMIGIGIYALCSAAKPKGQKEVQSGRFALSAKLRKKLEKMRELLGEKARRRRAKGIALCATCVLPIFLGAATGSDAGPVFGVAGMFAMIGVGVYELVMAAGEKKPVDELLKD